MGDDVDFVELAFMESEIFLADLGDELVKEACCDSIVLFPIVSKYVQAVFGV